MVDLRPRPLETIGSPDSQTEQLRAIIGPPSIDAVRLAGSTGHSLYADDLGLLKLARGYAVERSFSSVALLLVLGEAGVLTATDRDQRLLSLVRRGHVYVPPSVTLLEQALGASSNLGQTEAGRVFQLLGGPHPELEESARIVSQMLKGIVTSSIQVESVGAVTRLALRGMATRWPPRLCAHAVVTTSAEALALLPDEMREVQLAAASFVKGHDSE